MPPCASNEVTLLAMRHEYTLSVPLICLIGGSFLNYILPRLDLEHVAPATMFQYLCTFHQG